MKEIAKNYYLKTLFSIVGVDSNNGELDKLPKGTNCVRGDYH